MSDAGRAASTLDSKLRRIIKKATSEDSPDVALETALVGMRKGVVEAVEALAKGIDGVAYDLRRHTRDRDKHEDRF